MTWIIAVCGTMGCGKSTVVDHAVAAMLNSDSLQEDHFNRMTERGPDEIDAWWERDRDVSEFGLTHLLQELHRRAPDKATRGLEVTAGQQEIILLETHFGRLHRHLQLWIDFQVWVDIPADIAFARKVGQFADELQLHVAADKDSHGLRWIAEFCRGYMSTTGKLFEMQRQRVRSMSDVAISGQGTPLDVCANFLQSLPARFRQE